MLADHAVEGSSTALSRRESSVYRLKNQLVIVCRGSVVVDLDWSKVLGWRKISRVACQGIRRRVTRARDAALVDVNPHMETQRSGFASNSRRRFQRRSTSFWISAVMGANSSVAKWAKADPMLVNNSFTGIFSPAFSGL
jgi:hypothetical protein